MFLSFSVFCQDSDSEASSYPSDGAKAPNTHYIGEAWLHAIIHYDSEIGYNQVKSIVSDEFLSSIISMSICNKYH